MLRGREIKVRPPAIRRFFPSSVFLAMGHHSVYVASAI